MEDNPIPLIKILCFEDCQSPPFDLYFEKKIGATLKLLLALRMDIDDIKNARK